MQWVDTTLYLGETLDSRLTWAPHIDQVRNRTVQTKGMLCALLNRESYLSVRNGFLLYKQLIRPMMCYACLACRSAARTHVRRLQMLQFKCLRLTTCAPWYISNRHIHDDLGVPLFTAHIGSLTASFDWNLADVGNPLARQLGRHVDRRLMPSPDEWAKSGRSQQNSRGNRPRWPSRPNESRSALISRALFGYLDWGFPWFS